MKLYIEGGGDSKEQHTRFREAFTKLLTKAGLTRMPRIVAGGGRDQTFDRFKIAIAIGEDAMLLVDSEDPVTGTSAWGHLKARDGWDCPSGVDDHQAQLMVTCMETWIVADREALRRVFRACLHESALPPVVRLEERGRHDVQDQLEHATRDCGRTRAYRKGKRSFRVLAELDPQTLRQHLPHFQKLLDALASRL